MEDIKNQNVCHGGMCGGHGCGMGSCGCGCGMGMGWSGGHRILFMIFRCLLAIIILAVVFAFGVKVGELKGAYEYGGFGGGMMRGGWGGGAYQMYYQSAPMMRIVTSTAK